MAIEFILYVSGLIGVSYYMGHRHGLRSSIEHLVDQLVVMKFLNKIEDRKEDER